MGISGLLPMLSGVSNNIHIKECKGKTLAVDAYVWLHRGAYGCAEQLAKGERTIKYVNYSMHRVRMLKYYGVTPLIVFDGGLLPSKMGTEGDREKRRSDALANGRRLEAEGKAKQAREHYVKAVDVTPEMAYQLIKALRKESVQYIVAPFEADAQLAFLERNRIVDGIITEDSDLLIFGCENVYFKLDPSGNCTHLARKDFAKNKEWNFVGWDATMFMQMAILSGCDYLKSLKGVGLKTAHGLIRKYKSVERVLQFIRVSGKQIVPATYLPSFQQAELTFRHQLVYDPISKSIVPLTPLPEGMEKSQVPFIGDWHDDDYVRGVAIGDIDPMTKVKMVDLMPEVDGSIQYQSQPFNITKTKTNGKNVTVATGAASILQYFKPKPSTSTASTSKIKNMTTKPTSIFSKGGKGKGKEKEVEVEVKGGDLESKFFGGKRATVIDRKDLEEEEEQEDDEDLDGIIAEQEDGEGEMEAEFEAEEEYLREIEQGQQLLVAQEEAEDIDPFDVDTLPDPDELGIDSSAFEEPIFPAPTIHDHPNYLDRATRAQSSLIDFSSPGPELGHRRNDSGDAGFASEFSGVSSPERRGTSVAGEEDVFSSPSTSPRSDGTTVPGGATKKGSGSQELEKKVKLEKVVAIDEPRIKTEKNAAITATKQEKVFIKPEKVIKSGADSAPSSSNDSMRDAILLSSDPIEPFSEPLNGMEVDDEIRDPSPSMEKKPNIKRKIKEESSGKVKSKGKGKKRAREEEEDEEEVDPVKQSVAASWRARFMNPLSTTPKGTASPSTPQAVFGFSKSVTQTFESPSTSTPLASKRAVPSSMARPVPKPSSASTGSNAKARSQLVSKSPRQPLSPKSRNATLPAFSTSSPDVDEMRLPPNKVTITNRKLLDFKFAGSNA